MIETSSLKSDRINLGADRLLCRISNDVKSIIEQLNNYLVGSDQKYKFLYLADGLLKLFQAKFTLQFTRSRILIQYLQCVEEIDQELLINYCVTLEVLHLASELHGLIDSPVNSSQTFKISNEHIILFGDLLFTIAFEKILLIDNHVVTHHFVTTTQQIAESESLLSNLSNLEDNKNGYDRALAALSNKYWPLFYSILYFYKLFDAENFTDISQKIKKHHYEYVLKKIISGKLSVNTELHKFIYNERCIAYFTDALTLSTNDYD